MAKKITRSLLLRQLGIRHFDELIHDQPKTWLIKYFSHGADEYPVNVSLLMRNLVWQMRERVITGDKPPLKELVRTYWYMYVKPTLSRSGALSQKTDQYAQLVDTIVRMVKEWSLITYLDIGFRDASPATRKVGGNATIILFAEKLGHQTFLSEVADRFSISTLALGGQPSVMNIEYFVNDLKDQNVDIRKSFYLFSIVDYDPSGWIIRDALINNLRYYGIKNVHVVDLIHPDMLTPTEIKFARYSIPSGKTMETKNKRWLKEVHLRGYEHQQYLEDKTKKGVVLYGLEAEAVSGKRLLAKLQEVMVPLVGKTEDLLKIYELKELNEALKDLILHRML